MNVEIRSEACTLCGEHSSVLVQHGVRYGSDTDVRRCVTCGLVYLSPIPTDQNLQAYYGDHYRREFESPPAAIRFQRKRADALVRMSRLQGLLGAEKRVLEIGCDVGSFLSLVRPYVAAAVGVEPDNEGREWCRQSGLQVEDSLSRLSGAFDVAAMFHVLEHIPNPADFLGQVLHKMSSQARLVIEVPNVEDALFSLYKIPAFNRFYFQQPHLYYFSPQTIQRVLDKAGFDVETITGAQRYDLSNHISWMLEGQPGGQGKYARIFGDVVDRSYRESLIAAGYADTLWIVAKPRGSE